VGGSFGHFVTHFDSFMAQQISLYCVSSLSASYCNHNLTMTLAKRRVRNRGCDIACEAKLGENTGVRLREAVK